MNKTFISAVKKFAKENYNNDGWDYVVESYEDEEIWEVIKEAEDEEEAIEMMRSVVSIKDEYRKDIEAEAF